MLALRRSRKFIHAKVYTFKVISESTLYGGSKMGSTTSQIQVVDFLWCPKVGFGSGSKWTKMTKNGLGDFLP